MIVLTGLAGAIYYCSQYRFISYLDEIDNITNLGFR